MQSAQTQEQQKTPDSLHHFPAAVTGEKVSSETVLVYCGESGVLEFPQPHRDTSQNLVSEPQSQGQETAGGRTGEDQVSNQAAVAGLRAALCPERTGGRTSSLRGTEWTAARISCTWTFQWTLWDVLLVIIFTIFEHVP